jgi:hypothetical protein
MQLLSSYKSLFFSYFNPWFSIQGLLDVILHLLREFKAFSSVSHLLLKASKLLSQSNGAKDPLEKFWLQNV